MTSIIDRSPDGHKVSAAASDITAELGAVAEPRMQEAVDPILLYHPDAYRVDRKDIKGRRSAGDSFLRAFLAQVSGPDVYALCQSRQHFKAFSETVAGVGRKLAAKPVFRRDIATLRARSLVHLPHPALSSEARVRSFLGDDAYAMTGVTHTIASRSVLDDIADFVVAPTMSWDALICTSRAVHAAVSNVLKCVEDDLRGRLGATRFTRPLLPVIPLGIHTNQFSCREADRMRWRRKLGIGDDIDRGLVPRPAQCPRQGSPLSGRAGDRACDMLRSQALCHDLGWSFQQRLPAQGIHGDRQGHGADGAVPSRRRA